MNKLSEGFRKQVKHALIDRDMNLTDLANEMNITVSYLSELMNGTRKSPEQIARIKQVLNLTDIEDEQGDS